MRTHSKDAHDTFTVIIVVETDLDTLVLWEEARRIDPEGMNYANLIDARIRPDRVVEAKIAITEGHFEYLIAALGEDFAPSALEDTLTTDASEIIESADLEEGLRSIPTTREIAPFGPDTFAVAWSIEDAVMVHRAIEEAENELRDVKLMRMGREGDTVLLAVTVPPAMAEAVRAECLHASDEAGFFDPVLEKIAALLHPPFVPQDGGYAVGWPDDGDIPF